MKTRFDSSGHRFKAILLLAVFLLLLAFSSDVWSQQGKKSKEDLVKSKETLEKEIEYNRKLLAETQKNRKVSLGEVAILKSLIAKRESLIATIDREIDFLDNQIDNNRKSIETMKGNLERMKKEYARLLYRAYRSKASYQRLMFIFAAEDFNQAYQRLKFMQQYSRYRKRQAENIRQTRTRLSNEIAQ